MNGKGILRVPLFLAVLFVMASIAGCGGGGGGGGDNNDKKGTADATYDNASLSGAWMSYDEASISDRCYFISDGNGNITEFGARDMLDGSTCEVNQDGSMAFSLVMEEGTFGMSGTFTSPTAFTMSGTIDGESIAFKMRKISDVSLCAGSWAGTLTDSGTGSPYPVAFSVDAKGTLTLDLGFPLQVSGHMFCQEGAVAAYLSVAADESNLIPSTYAEMKFMGTLSGNQITGSYVADSSDVGGTMVLNRVSAEE